ncbi:MAG: D-aminoacyl-tRNA deacylase [Bacilli bacterium]
MKAIIQLVKAATLTTQDYSTQTIEKGMVIFVGFTHQDTLTIIDQMLQKILSLRVFADAQGKTNLSLFDIQGALLCVPNFTLYADVSGSRRPSFSDAAKPEVALPWFAYLQTRLTHLYPNAKFGKFGADMSVVVHNDGPFNLILSSDESK